MTIKDFFHLSESEYAERISKLPDEELMKHDIHNCRAKHSGAYGATVGALSAVNTAGLSLAGTAMGLRTRNVAKRRLELIHTELTKRGLPIHEQTKRDYLIPAAVAGVSGVIGAGVVDGVMGFIPVDSVADAGGILGTSITMQAAQEAAGKHIVAAGSEMVIGTKVPETGRRRAWKEKLGMVKARSAVDVRVGWDGEVGKGGGDLGDLRDGESGEMSMDEREGIGIPELKVSFPEKDEEVAVC